jgi:glycosyltransferase involved in cell wall biosynthesis
LLIDPRWSAREIAAAIEPALLSVDLRRRIGAAGRRVALEHFDQRAASKQLRRILETALTAASALT